MRAKGIPITQNSTGRAGTGMWGKACASLLLLLVGTAASARAEGLSSSAVYVLGGASIDTGEQVVQHDSASLTLIGHLGLLRSDLVLPSRGAEGSIITWSSDKPSVLSKSGMIVGRPAKGTGDAQVVLTATIAKGVSTATKSFSVTVAEDEGFSAYLFAYFTGNSGNQEAIRFALSDDGYDYKAINKNDPVLGSAAISSSGGVRDPHLLRGQNGDYYMVATDMVSARGWNSNRAMVLLRSTNLVDWKSSVVNIPKTYPAFAAADRVWAPETIYDSTAGKYMIYFAMRLGASDYDKIYYAYANSSFTGLESAPKVLYSYNDLPAIDADIVLRDGAYHLFFKDEGNGNDIKTAVSTKLTGGYVVYGKYVQPSTQHAEGPEVFRLTNSDSYILMYDLYTSGGFQFSIGTNLTNFSVAKKSASFDFTPRHGAVIPITSAEKHALNAKWNPTGILPDPGGKAFSAVMNSTGQELSISSGGSHPEMTASIRDLMGREVLRETLAAGNAKIGVANLPSGVYELLCTARNGALGRARIMVQRK